MPENESKEPFGEEDAATKLPWMLGFFDVLGFSDRIATDGIDKVYETYRTLIDRIKQKAGLRSVGLMRVPGKDFRVAALTYADVRYAYFSDTILLWLPLQPLLVGPFLQRCADLVCEALHMGIPLRGTIALGEGYLHRQSGTYLGELIVDAARLEAAQDWIGVAFAPSATWPPFVAEVSPSQIIEYEVPVKPGMEHLRSPIALDWPRRWRDTESTPLQARLGKLTPKGHHALYYSNAIAFADWSERHHNWHERPEQNGFKHLQMRPEHELQPIA